MFAVEYGKGYLQQLDLQSPKGGVGTAGWQIPALRHEPCCDLTQELACLVRWLESKAGGCGFISAPKKKRMLGRSDGSWQLYNTFNLLVYLSPDISEQIKLNWPLFVCCVCKWLLNAGMQA